ncbi:SLC13 family permease [Saccharopolyspora dendranthemae]|uniref:UIT1 family transporter n=1 Tax=Saccharopolyspora dendranthemae TaxID=1181886 RepID=A0A561U9G9_9PSEU|nr:SLC13 family permease [Saccharopolyspora dendranthemae]TWF96010.1 UIT1 family transporter [Saccharopolyspora dendranthemae]
MSAEMISICALGVMFVVATVLPINIGLLAFVGAFLVGTSALGLSEDEIFEGFPVSLFVTIVGVTYLFSVAQRNGTIDVVVRTGIKLVRGKAALIPWVLFAVAAVLTAFGTFTPAAVALLAPVGLNFAHRFGLSQLMVGMMVISGAHAGAFSPIAVSGALVLGMVEQTPLNISASALFAASFGFNLLLSLITFFAFGGVGRGGGAAATTEGEDEAASGITWRQSVTLVALAGLVVGALVFHLEIGFLALLAATALTLIDIRNQAKAVDGISWSTILLVAGMVTYVEILEKAGTIEAISHGAADMGAPLFVALLLCFVVAIVSAFASSTAILTAIIPIAVPLLLSSHLSAAGLVAALAVSTTIVDTSPFSTNGALVLSNARGVDQARFYRQIIGYTAGIVGAGPALAWGFLVLPNAF